MKQIFYIQPTYFQIYSLMKAFEQLDTNALNAVKMALDGSQRFAGQDAEKYFTQIIKALAGNIKDLNIWAIRDLIRAEDERRSRRCKTVKVVNPDDYNRLRQLSPQELRVLELISEGNRSEAVADLLNISYRTVANHKANLAAKLGLSSARELTKFAIQSLDFL